MISPSIKEYWNVYGSWRALFSSPFFSSACAISIVIGIASNDADLESFRQTGVSVLPSMLAFSLGSFTILLAMPFSQDMLEALEVGERHSLYMEIVVAIFHFILVQVIALVFTISAPAIDNNGFDLLSVFLTTYSILCGLASALLLLGFARIRNAGKI